MAVMVTLDRGDQSWQLCVRCYLEGIRPMNLGRIPAQYKAP